MNIYEGLAIANWMIAFVVALIALHCFLISKRIIFGAFACIYAFSSLRIAILCWTLGGHSLHALEFMNNKQIALIYTIISFAFFAFAYLESINRRP